MGNCAASKLAAGGLGFGGADDDDDPVSLCRERKRLLKAAVDRRFALAEAHRGYVESLRAVAAGIDLFVTRHSSPAPILITLPPPSPKAAALPFSSPGSTSTRDSSGEREDGEAKEEREDEEERKDEMGCGYFFSGEAPVPAPAPEQFGGWDFFNPFYGVQTAGDGLGVSSDEDLRVVREEEGIPELEEAEEEVQEKKMVALEAEGEEVRANGGLEEKGITVTETPGRGRELLEALRIVEDHFIRAYDSGKDVSRMLEANRMHLQTGLEEIKENSSKIIHAITWHRSPSSLSSSYRSHTGASSNSMTWTESKSDLFDDYGGMEAGSHSQTLGRLYAWEKKLYEEVKAGDHTWQAYQKKCLQLRNQDAKGSDARSVDKTRTVVRDLYTRIWVALRAAESISERIQKLRDEELQPQLIELLQGLMRTWKIMLESHESQKQIMFEVNSFTCPSYGKFSNDSQRHATLKLEAELRNWRMCFNSYVAAQKAYVEALDGWLSKFIQSDMVYYSRSRSSLPYETEAPPLVVICHKWLITLGKLPDKPVSCSMRSFVRSVRVLWVKQGEEQQQKRKVDSLAKDIDKRSFAFQRTENKVLESKLLEHNAEADVRHRVEYLSEKKEMLINYRKKLEAEKAKHHDCMQDTHEVTLNGFKIGLASIFESLTEFSRDSQKLYDELLKHNEKSKASDSNNDKPSRIGGSDSYVAVDSR
ncbi:protein ALTERED PHOSPHATE STARVATION RESPONSE 1-like [Typha latifolia]|uniref:protein ALTERED PHOSPHATE STARVATION RESPONSE 1-like n=1 Tax=Typha latifolia TaxID=4733 RepID=UPI003C3063E7